ncbi:hypothetical protein RFI_03535 [Reticulomyxa filosa]|uniref:Tetratricopeptide repeat protein n=1 Tax=Reticulomyxa filosa TaxID=46433 RepID=X6P5T5_RETFI|nr:hypothetical protein RFI_03535 [Reticulomyxa filosa]|eukprot:ETO33566.1 hypothetical protein RFI_03535 [Reticulomyxa filosa]
MKQKHVVGAFAIALFHCKSVQFEFMDVCINAYITNHAFFTMAEIDCICNEPIITIALPADFNQICELAFEVYDDHQLERGYSLYAIFLMEQNPNMDPKPSDTTLITLYGNLGLSYKEDKEYEKAAYYLEKQFEFYSKQLEIDNASLRDCLFHLGAVYFELRQYDKSISYLEKSLSIWLSSFDVDDIYVGNLYAMLGFNYYFKNQFEKERECMEKCLEIYLKEFIYYKIGCIYQRQKLYDKALEFHEKALDLRTKFLEDKYSDYSDYSDYSSEGLEDSENSEKVDISNCLDEDLGDFEKAISYHEKGLRIIRKCLNISDPNVELGDSYKSLGIAYEKTGNKSKAIENYENAIFTLHGKFGATHKKNTICNCKIENSARGLTVDIILYCL